MSKYFNRKTIHRQTVGSVINISPVIQMFSDKEVLIECVKNIECYNENLVRINTGKLTVTVSGEGLIIKCFAAKNLSVCGTVTGVEFKHN